MSWWGVLLYMFLALGAFTGYLLYSPAVPDDFPDPWKFRFTNAITKVMMNVHYLKMCMRNFKRPSTSELYFDFMNSAISQLPTAPEEVPGSNIRSRLRSFDGVKVRVYEPIKRSPEPLPAFVFLHGGGLMMGTLDLYDRAVRLIAERLDIVGVAVDYRLAPNHPFPAAFDDSHAATKWVLTHGRDLGIDPHRVALIGDSAGGYLTAAVAGAVADDTSIPDIKLQIMLWPWLQSIDHNTPSIQKMRCTEFGNHIPTLDLLPKFTTAYLLGSLDDQIAADIYANQHTSAEFISSPIYRERFNHDLIPDSMKPACYQPPSSDTLCKEELWAKVKDTLTSTKFSPLLREDMSKMPRAYVVTCGCDMLRDDGIFYVKALERAGVTTEWVHYENGFHGIMWIGDSAYEIGRQIADGFLKFTKENL